MDKRPKKVIVIGTDNTETLTNALTKLKEQESQLQLLQECEKIAVKDFHLFYAYNSSIERTDSILTVIKSYLESRGK